MANICKVWFNVLCKWGYGCAIYRLSLWNRAIELVTVTCGRQPQLKVHIKKWESPNYVYIKQSHLALYRWPQSLLRNLLFTNWWRRTSTRTTIRWESKIDSYAALSPERRHNSLCTVLLMCWRDDLSVFRCTVPYLVLPQRIKTTCGSHLCCGLSLDSDLYPWLLLPV